MIRLINNKKTNIIIFKTNGENSIFLENEDKQTAWNKNGVSDKTVDTYFDSLQEEKTYLKFISKIREETSLKIPGTFLVIERNKKFFIFKSDLYSAFFFPVVVYKPENDSLYEFTRKLFRIDNTKNFVILSHSNENNFMFITTWQVLEVLYSKVDIESSGEELYTKFYKPKKSGGMREIIAPHEKIKAALCDLNYMLQRVYDNRNSEFQVAYKKGKNIKSGVKLHANHKYVYNIDLSDFYPSCKKEIVKRYTDFLFAYAYNREFIEEEFFKVIFINDGLFIGSPISGTLANTVISSSVRYLNNMCKKYDIALSVYADDITFSSDKFIVKEFIVQIFNEAFAKYNLESYYNINEKKCVGFSGCNRKVTGVSINNNDKITVSRKYYRNLRVQIDHLSKGDTSIDIGRLRGQIAYATMIDDSGKIYNYLNKYLPTVKTYNLCSDEKLEELKTRAGL